MENVKEVLSQLYEDYSLSVLNFLVYYTGDRHLAEDLVQETFLRVIRNYTFFEGRSSQKTWILKIAKNVAIDHGRRRRFSIIKQPTHKFDHLPGMINTEEMVLSHEDIAQIHDTIRQLRPHYRLVVVLRGIEGLSTSEVAQILDWSESKVKTNFYRGRKELEKRLAERGIDIHASSQ